MNPPYWMPPQNQPPPEPPEPRYKFRWSILIGIPLAIAAVLFIINGVEETSLQFEDIMRFLGVNNQSRYVRLACLCVVGLAIILIAKLFRNQSDE